METIHKHDSTKQESLIEATLDPERFDVQSFPIIDEEILDTEDDSEEDQSPHESRAPRILTRSDIDHYTFDPYAHIPEEKLIYPGFLPEGDLAVWIGEEKSRKTTLLLQFAMCAALGKPFLTFPCARPEGLSVFFVDYESKEYSIQKRYSAIRDVMNLTPQEFLKLQANLHILEMRKAQRDGKRLLPPFPYTGNKKELEPWKVLFKENPADLYIFDPMRSFHAADENDSGKMEKLFSGLREVSGGATTLISHHMRKNNQRGTEVPLRENMRAWSDGARGSGAIKAHADVIVCQERTEIDGEEWLDWGLFLKDAADVLPRKLVESGPETFFWLTTRDVPGFLKNAYEVLKGHSYSTIELTQALINADISRTTAYRQIGHLKSHGLLVRGTDGRWEALTGQ